MIEDGAIPKSLALRDPVRAIKEVSARPDVPARGTCPMESGKKLTAVPDPGRVPRDGAGLRRESNEDRRHHARRAPEVGVRARRAARATRWNSPDKIDWVIKKKLIESYMRAEGARRRLGSTRRCACSTCSTTTPARTRGFYAMLERQGRVERICQRRRDQRAAIHTPPADTRAYFRGECLRRYAGRGVRRELGLDLVRGRPTSRSSA